MCIMILVSPKLFLSSTFVIIQSNQYFISLNRKGSGSKSQAEITLVVYVCYLHKKNPSRGIKSLIWLNQPDLNAPSTRDPSDQVDFRHYSLCKMSRVHVVYRGGLFTVAAFRIEYGSGFNMYLSVVYRGKTETVFHWQTTGQSRHRPLMFYV